MAVAPSPRPPVEKATKNSKPLMIAAAVVLLCANVGFWFYRAKIEARNTSVRSALPAAAPKEPALENVTLDPFLVNLAGGEGYLKATMTLSVRPGSTPPDVVHSALVRDVILSTLSTENAGALLTVEGKEALKKTLKAELGARVPGLVLDHVYFTEFLVQR